MKWRQLSEKIVLIEVENSHAWAEGLRELRLPGIKEIVPTDREVAVQFDDFFEDDFMQALNDVKVTRPSSREIVEIPVCYELGLDWERIIELTKLDKEEVIKVHEGSEYRATYGFTPGFLYLSGLDFRLQAPRLAEPRIKIPKGSVGIGGTHTGIYSLEGPGGWNILGRTPIDLFDIRKENPVTVPNMASVRFHRITQTEFDQWS